MEKQDHIPDYGFFLEDDTVHIYPKDEFQKKLKRPTPPSAIDQVKLKPDTYEKARRFAEQFDVYFIENEWRATLFDKNTIPDKPEGSFINYVKWYTKNH